MVEHFDVSRILIDKGSSWDIMYYELFEKIGLKREILWLYEGSYFHAFNDMITCLWGVLQVNDIYGIRERRLILQLTVPHAPKHKCLRLYPPKALHCHLRHRSLNGLSQDQIP